jgi:beta-lactamase class A
MKNKGAKWVDVNTNISSPKDMGIFLKGIYEFKKANSKLGNELVNNMVTSVEADRLPKLLPKTVKVAHKVGSFTKAYHDVGIIYTSNPYVLCVMSSGVNGITENFEIIANISKKAYDYSLKMAEEDKLEKEKKKREDQKKNKVK